MVTGEPRRAFSGNQFGDSFLLFVHYEVPLWVPEVGGAIDADNEAHDLILSVFGGMSKGDRNRQWIAGTQARRKQAEGELRVTTPQPQPQPGTPLSRHEIAALLRAAGNLTTAIHQADPTHKAELYKKLGIRLRYDPGQQKVLVESHLDQDLGGSRGVPVRVGRGT
ncbi:hypothetical protein [Streptomyces spirodelae]|uniref:Uncharacterized protein n=1 Tax=Streptomyces spirodelae TaxID=2812904 RepID=A0ABS3WS15_9ACTN|nr:hypothetical protein [Streptomyces spirodelae]MBO8185661.1 hypothetical protein [Streptomyces spirodelae]